MAASVTHLINAKPWKLASRKITPNPNSSANHKPNPDPDPDREGGNFPDTKKRYFKFATKVN